jgi:hypothetical protein
MKIESYLTDFKLKKTLVMILVNIECLFNR